MSITLQSSPMRAVPTVTGVHHLGLTVRDVDVSEAWYTAVLGLSRLFVEPHSAGAGYAVVMTRAGTELFVGLDHHPDAVAEPFSPLRAGLDHLSLQVPNRADLDAWTAHLDSLGVPHGGIAETDEPVRHAQVVMRDPDGIPVELFWFGG